MLKRPAAAGPGAPPAATMASETSAGTPVAAPAPGTPSSAAPPPAQPGKLVGLCGYCMEQVFGDADGNLPAGCVSRSNKLKCPKCAQASSSLNRWGVGLNNFHGLGDDERADFWKTCHGLRGNKAALLEFCEETRKRRLSEGEERGAESKPMPLQYYTNLGFDGAHIEETYKDDPQVVVWQHGTKCYKLPLAYSKDWQRDVGERTSSSAIRPDCDGRSVLQPKAGKKKDLPPRGSDHTAWTGDQIAAWSGYLVTTARTKGKELADLAARPEWSNVPRVLQSQHSEMVSRWNYVCNSQKGADSWYHSHEQLDAYLEQHRLLLRAISKLDKFLAGVLPAALTPPAVPAQAPPAAPPKAKPAAKPKGKAKAAPAPASPPPAAGAGPLRRVWKLNKKPSAHR